MARINIYTEADYGPATLEGWFDPIKAIESIEETIEWDERAGHRVSLVAGGFEEHEHLYRTPGGRWVLRHWSRWVDSPETHQFIDDATAKDWLLRNESDDIIEKYFGEIPDEAGPGRPEIGGTVNTRLGHLLPRVDAWAERQGVKRAEAIRQLVAAGLDTADLFPLMAHLGGVGHPARWIDGGPQVATKCGKAGTPDATDETLRDGETYPYCNDCNKATKEETQRG